MGVTTTAVVTATVVMDTGVAAVATTGAVTMEVAVTGVVQKKARKIARRLTTMGIVWGILGTILTTSPLSTNIKIARIRSLAMAVMNLRERKKGNRMSFRLRLKNLLKKKLGNCQNLEKKKMYRLLLL